MLFLLLLLSTAHALLIHHRVFHPQGTQLEYVRRAQVSLDPEVSYSASSQDSDLSSHIQQLRGSNLDLSKAYYQVALQRHDDVSETQWDVSSVKLVWTRPIHLSSPLLDSPSSSAISFMPLPIPSFCIPRKTAYML